MALNQDHLTLLRSWAYDPEKFVREALNVEFISTQQKQGLKELGKLVSAKMKLSNSGRLSDEEKRYIGKRGISIMSGQGVGKDAFAAWAIIWFLCCYPFPKIPCTAPTGHQLKDVLWAEVHKWLRKSNIQGWLTWQSDKIYFTEQGGREWFAVARTANPKATQEEQAETLAGFHEDFLMVVVEEASGVPEPVFRPLEGTMTGRLNFALLIFNPTRTNGFAIDTHGKFRDQWVCLHWDAQESELVTLEQIAYMERKYGRDSNAFRVRVMGVPPVESENVLIPWEWVNSAVNRDIEPTELDPEIFGIDVGAGGDPSVILRRIGPRVLDLFINDTSDSEVLTGWCLGKIMDYSPLQVMIDTIGVGWAIEGNLRTRSLGANIIGINVAEAASNSDRFHRLRDELWWNVREAFEKKIISIPDDDELIGELTTIRKEEPNGKIKVESKKDMKKRGLLSPNKADSLCLTEYYSSEVVRRMNKAQKHNRYTKEPKYRELTWMAR